MVEGRDEARREDERGEEGDKDCMDHAQFGQRNVLVDGSRGRVSGSSPWIPIASQEKVGKQH